MKFSVLISVYYKENPQYFDQALESVMNQTVVPNQVVLVKDGPLGLKLEEVIERWTSRYPEKFKVVPLEDNMGLATALRIGLEHCDYDYVARMDSDDICLADRFEKQLLFLKKNPHVDLVGSYIAEFVDDSKKPRFVRQVPVEDNDVKRMMKSRSPVNHVTAFFKKNAIIDSGSYRDGEPVEDYDLWVRMMLNAKVIMNLPEVLVLVRVGDGMYKRRGNKRYINSWFRIQKSMYSAGFVSLWGLMWNAVCISVFIYLPPSVKMVTYKYFLRKSIHEL